MTNLECYQTKLPLLQAIPDNQAKSPTIPVDQFIQEAENTYTWCQQDKEKLIAIGLDWTIVDDVPTLAGALRQSESQWFTTRFTREEAQRTWNARSPQGYDLRNEILHNALFAYRKLPDLLSRAQSIADGSGHPDMIQDLNDLAVLGREHPEPLSAVGFDIIKLDQAADISKELASCLAAAATDRNDTGKAKSIRDKAYTLLKNAVEEIRRHGQFLFWRDDERIKGYVSIYGRRHRTKQAGTQNPDPAAVK